MSGNRVLVTGAAGFIGSHVAQSLLEAGHSVRTIDNFSTGNRRNLASIRGEVELVEGDIRSYERTHTATQGIDIVIHLAALPSVPRSVQDPLTTNDVNVTGTLNVVLAARDAGVRRVVFASSSSVYGRNEALPKRETLVPMPISPYGVSKLAAEQYCMGFSAVYGIEAVISEETLTLAPAPGSGGIPPRRPSSVSARRTHLRSVSAVIPSLLEIEQIAAHCEEYSRSCSKTRRTARSLTSLGYLVCLSMAPSSQGLEPPTKPGRFKVRAVSPSEPTVDIRSAFVQVGSSTNRRLHVGHLRDMAVD